MYTCTQVLYVLRTTVDVRYNLCSCSMYVWYTFFGYCIKQHDPPSETSLLLLLPERAAPLLLAFASPLLTMISRFGLSDLAIFRKFFIAFDVK